MSGAMVTLQNIGQACRLDSHASRPQLVSSPRITTRHDDDFDQQFVNNNTGRFPKDPEAQSMTRLQKHRTEREHINSLGGPSSAPHDLLLRHASVDPSKQNHQVSINDVHGGGNYQEGSQSARRPGYFNQPEHPRRHTYVGRLGEVNRELKRQISEASGRSR